MVTAKQIINSTKSKPIKSPTATALGSAGYDNVRDDLEKVKKIREGSISKTPTDNLDITNKAYVDSLNFWQQVAGVLSPKTATAINITEGPGYLCENENTIRLATKGSANAVTSCIIGKQAGDNIADGTTRDQTAVGSYSGNSNTGRNQLAFGTYAGYQNSGDYQSVFGPNTGYQNSGDYQSAFGYQAGRYNSGFEQTVFGYAAGGGISAAAGYSNSGTYQNAFGTYAGYQNSGDHQCAFGYYAGRKNSGNYCISIGYQAGYNNSGNNCVFIGYEAGEGNTSANQFVLLQDNVHTLPLLQGNFSTGQIGIPRDNSNFTLGAAKDAGFYYDGTDLNCNPKLVGTGKFKILGDHNVTGDSDIDGNQNVDGDSVVVGVRNQKYYCEAYRNSSSTIQIQTQNVWHPAVGLTQGECQGFIEDAGGTATINSIADAGGGDITITTAAAHGFSVDDPVALVGGTGYDSVYMITAVGSSTTFDVTAAFAATGTGIAIVGNNVEATVDGKYFLSAGFSGNGLTGASTFEFDAFINATRINKGAPSRKFANTTDRGNLSGSFIIDLAAGDKIMFCARNITNTNNFLVEGSNLNIHRI